MEEERNMEWKKGIIYYNIFNNIFKGEKEKIKNYRSNNTMPST